MNGCGTKQGRNRAEIEDLARSVVIEVSHQRRAMQLEGNCLRSVLDGSSAAVSLEHLHRYRTASQRGLLRQLARLRRLHPAKVEPAEKEDED